MKIIQNAIHILGEDIYLKSEHVHHYVTHTFPDGLTISIDGGTEYCKRSGDFEKIEGRYEECCLHEESPFEGWVTDSLLWGSRGKDGKTPLFYRPIKDFALREDGLAHMKAILANVLCINPLHKRVIEYWVNKLEQKQTEPTS